MVKARDGVKRREPAASGTTAKHVINAWDRIIHPTGNAVDSTIVAYKPAIGLATLRDHKRRRSPSSNMACQESHSHILLDMQLAFLRLHRRLAIRLLTDGRRRSDIDVVRGSAHASVESAVNPQSGAALGTVVGILALRINNSLPCATEQPYNANWGDTK